MDETPKALRVVMQNVPNEEMLTGICNFSKNEIHSVQILGVFEISSPPEFRQTYLTIN